MEFNTKQQLLSASESNNITVKKESFAGDKFFMRKTRAMIRNDKYRKVFSGPGTLYEYLWSKIIRAKINGDIYSLHDKYYDKGFLAVSVSIRKLAKECNMDKNTVKKHTRLWEKLDLIKRDKVFTGVKDQYQYIYILGTWQYIEGVKKERLYIEDEFEYPG